MASLDLNRRVISDAYGTTRRFFGFAPFDDPTLERRFKEHYRADAFDQLVVALMVMTIASVVVYLIFGIIRFEEDNWIGGNQSERLKRVVAVAGLLAASLLFRHQVRTYWEWFSVIVVMVVYGIGGLSTNLRMISEGWTASDIYGWRFLTTQMIVVYMTFPFMRVRLWILVAASVSSTAIVITNSFSSPTHLALGATGASFAILGGCAIWLNNYRRERLLFERTIEREIALQAAQTMGAAARSAEIRANDLAYQQRQLIRAITHDIRQPMSAIGLQMALLRRSAREHPGPATLDIGPLSFALNALQSQLDEISTKLTSGSKAVRTDVTSVDIVNCIRMAVQFHEPLARSHGMSIRMHQSRHDATVIGVTNLGHLSTILESIIANAIRFRKPSAGQRSAGVVIGIRRHARRITVRVVDNGIGIKADDLPLIFDAGFSAGTSSVEVGSGFGLFNVKRLIKLLPSHTITVASRAMGYTSFRITMPEASDRPSAGDVPLFGSATVRSVSTVDGQDVLKSLRYRSILIVENDERVSSAMGEFLRTLGAYVTIAATSSAGMTRIVDADVAFDALVCDYRLGDHHTGDEVIRFARDHYGVARAALIISGDMDVSQAVLGDIPLIRKPFDPEELVEVLIRELARADLCRREDRSADDEVPIEAAVGDGSSPDRH